MGLCLNFLSVLEGEADVVDAVDVAKSTMLCQLSRENSVSESGICSKVLRKAPMFALAVCFS